MHRVALKVLGATGLAGATGASVYAANDEGTRRSLKFWRGVMPVYMQYRLAQRRLRDVPDEIADVEWDRLHDRYAPEILALTLELKGFYLKQAQFVSTRDEFIPEQYLQQFKLLQDQVPTTFAPGQAAALVEESLGRPLSEVFSEFDEEPLGAASIGQVHRARLLSTGEEVAVKVQYPGIEKKFRADLKTTAQFCELAMPQHVPAMKEIENQFMTEFDYEAEARNQALIRRNLIERGPFADRVRVPKVHLDLCTKTVLVMEYLRGQTLVAALKAQMRRFARMAGKTEEELAAEHKRALKLGHLNYHSLTEERWRQRGIALWLWVSDWLRNTMYSVHNLVTPSSARWPIEWTPRPIDLAGTLQLLNDVHAHELFVDGAFNGDCHPGNILLCDSGHIGLIDYGQVKFLTEDERAMYSRLVLALARDDRAAVTRCWEAMGCRTKYRNPDVNYRLAAFWNDRDTDEITGGRNIQTFLDWAQETDPVQGDDLFPTWAVMPARLSVLLRGMGMAFGVRFRTAPLWAPYAADFLKQYEAKKQLLASAAGQPA